MTALTAEQSLRPKQECIVLTDVASKKANGDVGRTGGCHNSGAADNPEAGRNGAVGSIATGDRQNRTANVGPKFEA